MKKGSFKKTRIDEEVLRGLSSILQGEVKDPRISAMCSVVAVDVTPDLKSARVYISVLGDEKAQEDTMAGLRSSAGFIRGRLASHVNLRHTPELHFVLDQSIAYGVKMSRLIDEVNRQQEETE